MTYSTCKSKFLGKVNTFPLCDVKVPSRVLSSFFDGLINVQSSTYPSCKDLGIKSHGNLTTLLSYGKP